jgi:hypothetical protein
VIGLRHSRIGHRDGVRVGSFGGAVANPMAGVAQDATSSKYVPATAAQWTTTMSAAGIATGNPTSLWLCQEASGSLADSIGTQTLPSEGARQSYGNVISGWTRKALQSVGDGWYLGASPAPDPATTSSLTLVYALVGAGSGIIVTANTGQTWGTRLSPSASLTRVESGATFTDGAVDPTGSSRPWVYKLDRSRVTGNGYTDQEKLSVALGSPTGPGTYFSNSTLVAGCSILYVAQFTGTAAELSDANVRSLLQVLGWSPAW